MMCLVFQDTWYEFRVLAVMQDLISEPSNVAGVSSTGKGFCFLLPPFAWLLWEHLHSAVLLWWGRASL